MPFFPQALARLMPGRARVPEQQKASATGALVSFEQLGQPVWSPRDYAAFAREGFMQNAICYRSVRMIAEAAASIPLLLYEGDTEVSDHPLIDLLRRPSLDHTGTDFLEAWYGFLLVAGNAYVEAVPLDSQLRELHVLRPDRMKVIPGPDGWPEGYEYTAGGQSIRFIDDVLPGVRPILHMRMFNPLDDHYGMSPIEAASVAIDIHNTASSWNKALLDNSARPSGALVYGAGNGQMTAEQFARLKSELETSFEGARNAGRPLLLEGGLDWKPLSMSPKDMDFIEAKNSAAREIALALGVPPMLLGIPGDNTYSNYREASRALWRQTVLPLVNRTARAFSAWLEPAYGGALELKPDLDAIEALSSEREALWSRLQAASFLTDDEKRAVIGYGPKGAAKAGASPFDRAGGDQKFNQDQPRVPAGNGKLSGEWVGGVGSGVSGAEGDARLAMSKLPIIIDKLKPLLKPFLRPKLGIQKLPAFLEKVPGAGKIIGRLEGLTPAERSFAEEIRDLGHQVEIVPHGAGSTPDFLINGVAHELKTVTRIVRTDADGLSKSISSTILDARTQSARIIIDARGQTGMTREAADQAIRRAYGADLSQRIESVTIMTPQGSVYAPKVP